MAGRSRTAQTARDMVLSMAVVVGVVVLVLLLLPRPQVQQPEIDVEAAARGAAERLGGQLLVPRGLAEDWVVTGSVVDEREGVDAWRLTLTSPQGRPVSLWQAPSGGRVPADEEWVAAVAGAGSEQGVRAVDGERWVERSRAEGSGSALVSAGDDPAVVVVGRAGPEELVEMAEALEPLAEPAP